jgi:hypothetical protein
MPDAGTSVTDKSSSKDERFRPPEEARGDRSTRASAGRWQGRAEPPIGCGGDGKDLLQERALPGPVLPKGDPSCYWTEDGP